MAERGAEVRRQQVRLDRPIKSLGVHDVRIALHPEVTVTVKVNVARSPEEAEIQARGGTILDEAEDEADEAAEGEATDADAAADAAEDAADTADSGETADAAEASVDADGPSEEDTATAPAE